MIDEQQIEQLIERLVDRIEQANLAFLEEIGKSIKQLGKLMPSKAQQLINILKYGSNYNDIVYKISQITNLNIKDIDEIFHAFAEKDRLFYKQFYEYRNLSFTTYRENRALVTQVQALANITKNELANFMNTRALGYSVRDLNGNVVFKGLREVYTQVLDEAILNVGQGKSTFDTAMRNTLKQLGGSGLKTVDYKGRSMRLDSAIRMNMQGALRNLHNETQKIYGAEFDSDGIEISVHLNPAPDHAEVQGRQFSNEEFNKFQNDIDAVDYKGKLFTSEFEGKDRRAISEYNCYHYIFSIILGVSQPQYSNEQLQNIINENNKTINIDGKEYTKYECTQLQRKYETAIRKQKDIQILAKASGNDNLVLESQQNITQLTNKYREISKKANLPTKVDRLRVSGYKRVAIKK
ncbi:phage minor capsid protein [uncultured Rikenella sp.]|uniref:phage minor capsid protein n=1 Tax=uncultured Rikenella sp. TaxID=368003 RepID=UPI00261C3106|nr:phage minor capsid protein [uncultured Rikenella sp.]